MVNCIVIDDNQNILDMFCDFLDVLKIDVLAKGKNGRDAVDLYGKCSPDIVFTDLAMPEYDGMYAVENILDKNQNAKIIVVTANSDDCDLRLLELLNIPVISKPFGMDVLKQAIADISKTGNSIPASFEIRYKFKDDYDYYSCIVNYEQYRNFKKLDIMQECKIVRNNDENAEPPEKEIQKALDLAALNDTSHMRNLSEVVPR